MFLSLKHLNTWSTKILGKFRRLRNFKILNEINQLKVSLLVIYCLFIDCVRHHSLRYPLESADNSGNYDHRIYQ